MKLKRLMAYVIDIFMVSFIASLIMLLPGLNQNVEDQKDYVTEYYDYIFKSTGGSSDIDEEKGIEILYNMEKSAVTLTIVTTGILFLYFGVAAYICNGQTIGKKIFNIKIVPQKGKNLNQGLFILRSILVTQIPIKIASILAIMYCKIDTWYQISSVIGYISNIFMFIMLGFIIFRDDERGLHDLICNTKVISTKE